MNTARNETARGLIRKADNDLRMAKIGLQHDAPLDTVCFHIQQSAEKLLKAVLANQAGHYPFTHDLRELLLLAVDHFPSLEGYRDTLPSFTSFAVAMRYDESIEPDLEETKQAFQIVQELRKNLAHLLPSDSLP